MSSDSQHNRTQESANIKSVPFFRPEIGKQEIQSVVDVLHSGWLTTGPMVNQFESMFAEEVGAKHAVALNSCTAGLHLALHVLGVKPGDAVLVPTLTFAATAEVVTYLGAVPILVDCDPVTGNLDLLDAEHKLDLLQKNELPVCRDDSKLNPVGIMPVHVGGYMMDMTEVKRFAEEHNLWIVEDAAHAFPAAYRTDSEQPWKRCGEKTADITCYSFYANKTITTGEGGMAVTESKTLAEKIRMLSLHGLSKDAWKRYSGGGTWDYQIVELGHKYNMTDLAAAIGLGQLERAEQMRRKRKQLAQTYSKAFAKIPKLLELPIDTPDRVHSWHLYPIRLNLNNLSIDRNKLIEQINSAGIGTSVHWRPLHLHPVYQERFGWKTEHLPNASTYWERVISLPLFPSMTNAEQEYVINIILQTLRDAEKK